MLNEKASSEVSAETTDAVVRCRPTGKHCQKKAPYNLKGLLSLPIRLAYPPQLPKSLTSPANRASNNGEKRSSNTSLRKLWSRSPAYLVELTDVIGNIHFSPLSARDFQDFLIYEEFAPENLYFYHWLEAYTKLFKKANGKNAGEALELSSAPKEVVAQFEFGMKTFFAGGTLELNLPGQIVQDLKKSAEHSINPILFEPVKCEVVDMLEASKRNWLLKHSGNSNRNRAIFAICLGIGCVILSSGLMVALLLCSHSRAVRTVTVPLLWLGVMLIFQGHKRTCIVMYAFGDLRQLHSWELKRLQSSDKLEAYTPTLGPSPPTSPLVFQSDDWLMPQRIDLSTPVFSPVTKVESPLMKRILRYNVLSGASWGLLFLVIWVAVWIPQPILAG